MKETISTFSGQIKGFIETHPNGDKTVTDFCGRVLGYYKKSRNVTTDFYGRVIANGDWSAGLIKIDY